MDAATLPEVKTRDEAEMQHIFAEMVSPGSPMVKQAANTLLNSAAGVRSMQDLEENPAVNEKRTG